MGPQADRRAPYDFLIILTAHIFCKLEKFVMMKLNIVMSIAEKGAKYGKDKIL